MAHKDTPQTHQKPKPRKLVALLTDDEWRALRIQTVERDTTIQAYVTQVLLREVQRNSRRKA